MRDRALLHNDVVREVVPAAGAAARCGVVMASNCAWTCASPNRSSDPWNPFAGKILRGLDERRARAIVRSGTWVVKDGWVGRVDQCSASPWTSPTARAASCTGLRRAISPPRTTSSPTAPISGPQGALSTEALERAGKKGALLVNLLGVAVGHRATVRSVVAGEVGVQWFTS